jgi:arylsulfatase A-like enzyme
MSRLACTTLIRLAAPAVVALVALAGCAAPTEIPKRSNILLVTIDTLRADHLSSYGYERATSPVIDRLAAEGVRFDQPSVQWPKTGPSFASIFTSTYPNNNGIVRKVGIPLPQKFRMLAEELKAAGYSTHAVVANGAVSKDFFFDQGFDTYVESWRVENDDGIDTTGAEAVNRRVLELLPKIDRSRPFFLWVHYLDPHFPYTPPGEWSDKFQNDEFFDPTQKLIVDMTKNKIDMVKIGADQVLDGRDDLAFYIARYDAEIAYNDAKLGELLEELGDQGLMEKTLTVLSSDHGESLADHYYNFDHGRFGFQTCVRVPLIFHYPGVIEPRVDPDPVELIDLSPTLLEIAGTELEDGRWMEGSTLSPRLLGQALPAGDDAYAFSEAGYAQNEKWQRIVRDRRYKLVDSREGGEQRWITGEVGRRFALYDLIDDPDETVNLFEEKPEDLERLRKVLRVWYREEFDPLVDADAPEADDREMGDDTREQLKALGYLD